MFMNIPKRIFRKLSMHTKSTKNGSTFHRELKVIIVVYICEVCYIEFIFNFIEYEWQEKKLRYVRINFDTPTLDRITKDRSAKFVDMLSAIGGTMGLLTGFSIISGVEIIYFVGKMIFTFTKNIIR